MRLFNKKHLEIIKFSTNDPTRQALHGLLFDGNKTVATDGHRLICVESNIKEKVEWPANGVKWSENDKSFTLSRGTVEKALKNIPRMPNLPGLENAAIGLKTVETGHHDKVVCQTTDLDNTDNVEAKTVDGKFPNYEQVIPDFKNEELYLSLSVNATYLKEVCNLLEKYQKESRAITLYIKKEQGATNSLIVTADDGEGTEATAVIMPLRP